jgi:hypothetical protein
MKPRDIVRLPKTVSEAGGWKVTTGVSRMPANAFALSRRAGLRLGRGWHWRVDDLASPDMAFRLLTTFDLDHEEFLSWLSTPVDDGLRVIARFEFHGTHPGWHCHAATCDHEEIPVGDPRPRVFERFADVLDHGDLGFIHNEAGALEKAFGFYHVTAPPGGVLI